MMAAKTTEIVFSGPDFYLAHLNNGGVRVGMKDVGAVDFPTGHAAYAEAVTLTEDTVEAFFDAQIEAGRFDLRAIR